jgi:hypothetical protein
MARADESEFQWNFKGEPQPESVLDTMASLQGEVEPRIRAGEYLIKIGSAIEQLQEACLSAEQRSQLVSRLRALYLYFQRLAAKERDKELRAAYSNYLSRVGGITLTPTRDGEEGEPFTFLEALATNEVVAWAHHFYSAFHQVTEQNGWGRAIDYVVDRDLLSAELSARRDLMRRLEED